MEYTESTILQPVKLPVSASTELPAKVSSYIDAGETRMGSFMQDRNAVSRAGFVPSDFGEVHRALQAVVDANLAPGSRFLEWGSGFGIAAGVAAELGFEAYGIEIRDGLVDESVRLAEEFEIDVEFVVGSFLPATSQEESDAISEYPWWNDTSGSGYDEIGLEIGDFDVVFAYPWPGEESVFDSLFLNHASTGALFVTYHGVSGMRVQRKVSG